MNPDNAETETNSVISGYFDDALSATECSDLAALLRTDPAAALEFARTARVHALLEAAAPPRPAGRAVVLRRRWLGLGAAAALLAAGSFATIQYFGKSPMQSPAPHLVKEDSGDFHIKRKPLPPGVNLRTVRATAPAAGGAVDLNHLLANFYIHDDPVGLTVPEALQSLERAIARANLLNRRELAALRFTAGRVLMPAGLGPEGSQTKLKIRQCIAKMEDLTRQWEAAPRTQRSASHEESIKKQLIEAETALETTDPAKKKKRADLTKRVQELEEALAAAVEKRGQGSQGKNALEELQKGEAERLAEGIAALERELDDLRRAREFEARRPSDPENPRINAPLAGPYTIKEYLDICSLYREIRQEPGGIIYGVPANAEPAGTAIHRETKTFRLPPDLFGCWFPGKQESPQVGGSDIRSTIKSAWASAAGEDPVALAFSGPPSFPPVNNLTFSRTNSAVTVVGSPLALKRWEQILNVCYQRKTVQHFLITKYIICPPALLPQGFDPATGMILNDEQFQILMRRLSQAKEVELMTAPSIIVRGGQPSVIKTASEFPRDQPAPPVTYDWLGLQQEVLTTCVGETIQVSGMVDLGLPAATGLKAMPDITGPPGGLVKFAAEGAKHHQTGFDLWIPNRCTAVFTLDVDTGDRRTVLACLTAQVLDPAGQPAGP